MTTTTEHWDIKRLIELCGPFTKITRQREMELIEVGKWNHVFTLINYDMPYEEMPEKDRPSEEEMKDRGETKEEYSESRFIGVVGHHLVNVFEIYEASKPMPEDLELSDENIWFGDDGLPES